MEELERNLIKCYNVDSGNEVISIKYIDGTKKIYNLNNACNYGFNKMQLEKEKRTLLESDCYKTKNNYFRALVKEEKFLNNISPYLCYLTLQYQNMAGISFMAALIYVSYRFVAVGDYFKNERQLDSLNGAREFYESKVKERKREK